MAALRETQGTRSELDLDQAYEKLTAQAARVFRLLTVHPGPDVSVGVVAALADLPVDEAQTALACLADVKLAETVAERTQRWRLVDVVRPYAQRLADKFAEADGREQARTRLLDYSLLTTEAADDRLRGLPAIPAPQEFTDRRDALAWLDTERASLLAVAEVAADSGRYQAAKSLPLLLAHYLGFRRRFDDLLAVSTVGLMAARCLGDKAAESDALTNLGSALFGLRRYEEAVAAQREATAIFREAGDQRGQADTLNNLGLALHGLGRNEEAATAHRDAVAIYRGVGDRHGAGNALNNLGLALRALRELENAAAAHRAAVDIYRESGDLHSVAMAFGNLGNVLRELGRCEEAVNAYQKATDIFRDTGDRPRELAVLQDLTATQAEF